MRHAGQYSLIVTIHQ